VQTTVPFKPTQGRPVLCRQCFQIKNRAAASSTVSVPAGVAVSAATTAETVSALTEASTTSEGLSLSADAAILAATSMAAASPESSVASAADLASISSLESVGESADQIPTTLLAGNAENGTADLLSAAAEAQEA